MLHSIQPTRISIIGKRPNKAIGSVPSMAALASRRMISILEMSDMFRTISLITILGLGIASCCVLHPLTPLKTNASTILWLGALPHDEFYSARFLDIKEKNGILVTRSTILVSNDSGVNWDIEAHVNGPEALQGIIGAWRSSTDDLYLLSDSKSLQTGGAGLPVTIIPAHVSNQSYMDINGDTKARTVIVVGAKNIPVTKDRFAELPHYAQGSDATSPSVAVPIIAISNDHGKTWESVNLPKAIGYLDGVKESDQDVVAWGPYAVYASTDGGQSWNLMTMDVPDHEEDSYPISASIIGDQLYVSLKNGRILAGAITGHRLSSVTHLSRALSNLTFFNACTGFGVSSEDRPKVHQEEDVLMETQDGGKTWISVVHARRIVALAADDTELYGASFDRMFRIHVDRGTGSSGCGR